MKIRSTVKEAILRILAIDTILTLVDRDIPMPQAAGEVS
jgi:hypothetical protein